MSSASPDQAVVNPRPLQMRVAWNWVAACEIPGAGLILLAFVMEDQFGWQGVSIATMVAIGTALLLAGVLFFFERRFLTDVTEAAAAAGTTAAQAEVARSTKEMNVRIEELSHQMQGVLAHEAEIHDEAVAAMSTPTFDSVATAMAHANQLGALRNGSVTVQGSEDPDEVSLTFSWGMDMGDGRFRQPARIALTVRPVIYADLEGSGPSPFLEIGWKPDESAAAAGLRLRAGMTQRGRLRSDGSLRWDQALANLQKALDFAIRSRRRDTGTLHLAGALSEYVTDEWMITEAGLECPVHGFVFPGDSFPSAMRMSYAEKMERRGWMPEDRPVWVDEDLWKRLVSRGLRTFPILRRAGFAPSWIPVTRTPGQLRAEAES